MLQGQGAQVSVQPDKDQALTMITQKPFDLILMDTRLGKVNALSFTQILRAKMPVDIPIIGMSSVDLQGRGIYSGLDEVLIRPVEYSHLIKAIRKLGGRMKKLV